MTERDVFLAGWRAETPAFLRVLKALPGDRLDYRPHERSPSDAAVFRMEATSTRRSSQESRTTRPGSIESSGSASRSDKETPNRATPLNCGPVSLIFHAMIFKADGYGNTFAQVVSLRCPGCRQIGTLEPFPNQQDLQIVTGNGPAITVGHRRCPNPACHAYIFFAWEGGKVLVSYPAERIDFDSSNLPEPVRKALEEAITCHAHGCYAAGAMLVRKTLEALCDDRQAKGKDLKERIKALESKVLLPKELLDGLDDIRLLGNDAAHIESRTYDDVGQEEVEIAIEFSKEVLKAVYQYSALLNRLRSLKKSSPPTP